MAVGELVGPHEADVLSPLLERFDADVLEDVLHPDACPHRVRHGGWAPRESAHKTDQDRTRQTTHGDTHGTGVQELE